MQIRLWAGCDKDRTGQGATMGGGSGNGSWETIAQKKGKKKPGGKVQQQQQQHAGGSKDKAESHKSAWSEVLAEARSSFNSSPAAAKKALGLPDPPALGEEDAHFAAVLRSHLVEVLRAHGPVHAADPVLAESLGAGDASQDAWRLIRLWPSTADFLVEHPEVVAVDDVVGIAGVHTAAAADLAIARLRDGLPPSILAQAEKAKQGQQKAATPTLTMVPSLNPMMMTPTGPTSSPSTAASSTCNGLGSLGSVASTPLPSKPSGPSDRSHEVALLTETISDLRRQVREKDAVLARAKQLWLDAELWRKKAEQRDVELEAAHEEIRDERTGPVIDRVNDFCAQGVRRIFIQAGQKCNATRHVFVVGLELDPVI